METKMEIRPIRNDDDYQRALQIIEDFFDSPPDSPESDMLDVIVALVDSYEKEVYPIPLPDPIEAIKFRMEAMGLQDKDLEPFIGSRARVWEILNRKRPLSLRMIRSLEAGLGIPAEVLIHQYEIETNVLGRTARGDRVSPFRDPSNYYVHFVDLIRNLQASACENVISQIHEENDCYWGVLANTILSSTSVDSIGDLLSSDSENSSYIYYRMSDPKVWNLLREGCFERYWVESSLDVPTQEEVLE